MMVEPTGSAKRVTIVLRSGNLHGGPERLLEALRNAGAAGATAFRGAAGFVGTHPIHSTRFAVDFVPDLPVVILWIDRADAVDRILPQIVPLIKDGLVSVDDTAVLHNVSAEVSDLPPKGLVRDVMVSEVVSATRGTPIVEIVKDLVERQFRAVPVVDDERRVVGVITNSDLVERGGLSVRLELLQAIERGERDRILQELAGSARTAGDVMTSPSLTVPDTATAREAAAIMLKHQLKRLPVVDDKGRLAGMVSRVDLLRTVTVPEVVTEHGEPGHRAASDPVTRVMNKDVPVVAPDDPVSHLINVIVSTRLNRAVVIDGDRRPIGVVSDAELIQRVTPEARPGVLTAVMRRLPLLHGSDETQDALRHAKGKTARDFMEARFARVRSDATVEEALRVMLDEQRKIAVVVDSDGRLRGMIDRRDLLHALA